MGYIKNIFLRIYFWWIKKKFVLGVDFKYVDDEATSKSIVILMLKNPLNGVKIEITGISLFETDDGGGELNYEVIILENPNNCDVNSPKFARTINDLMRVVVSTAAEVDKNDEIRALDSAQSNEERNIREEGSSVSQGRVSKRKPRKKTVSGDSELSSDVQQPTKRKRPANKSKRKEKPDGE